MIKKPPTREIARGKTKVLTLVSDVPYVVDVKNLDDITAGDGALRDSFPHKGEYSTYTNNRVFKLLERSGVPVAYLHLTGPDSFRALQCTMLPFEVVAIRQVAEASSFRKREPGLATGARFNPLRFAYFLKTKDRIFGGIELPKDDPYIREWDTKGVWVCRPDEPILARDACVRILKSALGIAYTPDLFVEMRFQINRVFLILEHAWALQGCTLCDLKIEFGYTHDKRLVVADVIDNDSWRLLDSSGKHLDKQRYRDKNTSLERIAELYAEVAEMTNAFENIGTESRF